MTIQGIHYRYAECTTSCYVWKTKEFIHNSNLYRVVKPGKKLSDVLNIITGRLTRFENVIIVRPVIIAPMLSDQNARLFIEG